MADTEILEHDGRVRVGLNESRGLQRTLSREGDSVTMWVTICYVGRQLGTELGLSGGWRYVRGLK